MSSRPGDDGPPARLGSISFAPSASPTWVSDLRGVPPWRRQVALHRTRSTGRRCGDRPAVNTSAEANVIVCGNGPAPETGLTG